MNYSSPIPALMAMQMNKSSSEDSHSNKNSEITKKVKKNCIDFNRPFLWVRSQSGLTLAAVSCFRIDYSLREFLIIDNNSDLVLGGYSTCDIANSVMNSIQQFIVSSSNGVFVMPEDKKKKTKGEQK